MLVGCGSKRFLAGVLGRPSLRFRIRLRLLEAPATPTGFAREPPGVRPILGGHLRSIWRKVRAATWTHDRLAQQVVEARCTCVAHAFGAAQRLHVSGDRGDLDDLAGLGAKSDCAAGASPRAAD